MNKDTAYETIFRLSTTLLDNTGLITSANNSNIKKWSKDHLEKNINNNYDIKAVGVEFEVSDVGDKPKATPGIMYVPMENVSRYISRMVELDEGYPCHFGRIRQTHWLEMLSDARNLAYIGMEYKHIQAYAPHLVSAGRFPYRTENGTSMIAIDPVDPMYARSLTHELINNKHSKNMTTTDQYYYSIFEALEHTRAPLWMNYETKDYDGGLMSVGIIKRFHTHDDFDTTCAEWERIARHFDHLGYSNKSNSEKLVSDNLRRTFDTLNVFNTDEDSRKDIVACLSHVKFKEDSSKRKTVKIYVAAVDLGMIQSGGS